MAFEEAFGVEIPEDAAEKISTVKDAIDYIEKQKAGLTAVRATREREARHATCGGDRHGDCLSARARGRARLAAPDQRPSPASARSSRSTPRICPARSPARCRPACQAEGELDIAEWIPVKDQKKMDRFIHLGLVAATEAVEDSGWKPETEEDRCATGVMIGSGIGGLQTIFEASLLVHAGQGAAAVAVLHPLGADQPRVRPRLDQIRLQGPEPLRGDRLRHRRARDRRRRAADHVGRRRRDGGRRGRSGGVRTRHRRVLRLARPVHRLQRPPDRGAPAPGTRTATAS